MVDAGLSHAILNGLVTGSYIALGAIGLGLVYNIAKVPNFAHGELLMLGAYFALLVNLPGTVPGFRTIAHGSQEAGAIVLGILFLVTFASAIGLFLLLGGKRAFKGGWWPIEVDPRVAVATHVGVALLLGLAVVWGAPSMWAAFIMSAVVLAAGAPLLDRYLFRHLRDAKASLATMLIVTMGLAFFLRFSTQAWYGGTHRSFSFPAVRNLFGYEVNVAAAKYFDFFFAQTGLTFRYTDTAPSPNEVIAVVHYHWLTMVGLLAGTVFVAYLAYWWRGSGIEDYEAAQTIGPRIVGSTVGIVTFVVLAVLLAQPGTNPDSYLYATRIRTSPTRLSVIVIAAALMIGLHLLLRETKLGKAMRASADNLDLAKVTGIDTSKVMMTTWIIAGAYAAVAGIAVGMLFHNIRPTMGFFLLLPMFAAVILGGLASVYGAILGSYVVGIAMEVGIWTFGFSGVHRTTIAFVVLLIVLLVRPEGIVGSR